MHSPIQLLTTALWPAMVASYAIRTVGPRNETDGDTSPNTISPLLEKRFDDQVSFAFIERWAAIGDSFTAGIGSGQRLGNFPVNTPDWLCSRYSYTWPQIVDRSIGGGRSSFQYPACSGARSEGIYEQAENLEGNLDVVMLTAGGNDLCLAAMIRECVMLPYHGEAACNTLINKANENINTILKPNVRAILNALKPKIKEGGIVIYNGYAPFFNTENEDCADPKKQKWALPQWLSWNYWTGQGLRLTVARRDTFNELVKGINKAIHEVVIEFQEDGDVKYDIEFSDWSTWPAEVDGQMCSPRSNGQCPDPEHQPEMHFFKPNTYVRGIPEHDMLKRREISDGELEGMLPLHPKPPMAEFYDSLLYKSPNPPAVALHKLDRRAPSPPNCPGDGSFDPTLGLGLPDTFAKNFHPNEKGHETIASFALQNLAYAKLKQQGKAGDMCQIKTEEFTCYQKLGRKAWVSWERLDVNYKDFCNNKVTHSPGAINWNYKHIYHIDTPEEVEFEIKLSNGAGTFDKAMCLESFDRIINSCDGNDPANPLNLKFGGQYKRGSYTYEIRTGGGRNREFITRTDGVCEGWYKVFWEKYTISGKGWAGWDYGRETLLPALKKCAGLGITSFNFEYYRYPQDHDGWEWKATFNSPLGVRRWCLNNLKVQAGAGGYTHRREDRKELEQYENFGCGGNA